MSFLKDSTTEITTPPQMDPTQKVIWVQTIFHTRDHNTAPNGTNTEGHMGSNKKLRPLALYPAPISKFSFCMYWAFQSGRNYSFNLCAATISLVEMGKAPWSTKHLLFFSVKIYVRKCFVIVITADNLSSNEDDVPRLWKLHEHGNWEQAGKYGSSSSFTFGNV